MPRHRVARWLAAWLALECVALAGNGVYLATRRFPITRDCEPATVSHCFVPRAIAGASWAERVAARLRGHRVPGHALNAQGYLGADFEDEPGQTVLTIFGASTSFPFCADETRDELAETLGAELRSRYQTRRFVVRNASVVGRSVFEIRQVVRAMAAGHHSDVVVVQEPINSINQGHDVVFPLARLEELEAAPPARWVARDPLMGGMLRLTKWGESLGGELARGRMRPELGEGFPSRFRGAVRFRSIEAAIRDLHAASRELGFTLVLGVLPMRPELEVTVIPAYLRGDVPELRRVLYDLHAEVNRAWTSTARELGVPLVDNATPFEEPALDAARARQGFCDYVHARPEVKRQQARNLADAVARVVPDAR
ncbi:MAG: hypothetical protein IPK07_23110 [Deltaproteobacteria bacterium]|nr:hypothetical protein [Deltaproteobacteria bacterium]